MTEDFQDQLAEFQAHTTKQERDRWKPLYRLLNRKEKQLRVAKDELADKGDRLDARAQYRLIQGLLAAAPILEPTPLRLPAQRTRRGSPGRKSQRR